MKNIKLIAFATVAGLFLTACGGGGSSSGGSSAEMVLSCGTGVSDVTGRTIKKYGSMSAEVKIVHSSDSNRSACMLTGNAEII